MTEKTGKELTGRKVFAITASAFAVIIGVNVFMAWQAIGTFPGLEVGNSYVASQNFDADRTAQEALGWSVRAEFDGADLKLSITDGNGAAVAPAALTATLGRATERQHDQELAFSATTSGAFLAPVGDLATGKWDLRLEATAGDGTRFRQRIELYKRGS
jgi:nitrogen fixation protein FixH